jgi:hypothetical protein
VVLLAELAVTATGDEHVRAFACEPLCRRQPDAAIATGDERDLSFELTHLFLLPRETIAKSILVECTRGHSAIRIVENLGRSLPPTVAADATTDRSRRCELQL